MYTQPLNSLINSHAILNQSFADDTQLYTHSHPSAVNSAIQNLEHCICNVKSWMNDHKLKLNDEKTEVMFIHSSRFSPSSDSPSVIHVGSTEIKFTESARNLGFVMSNTMSTDKHVSQICRSAYAALHQIASIRSYLDTDTTKKLVCALVLPRLDYANSLLANSPKYLTERLQRVQNSAARLVLKAKKRDHITPLLRSLHWLPVQARIQYKVLSHCHNFFMNSAPAYISDLLTIYCPTRTLRSSSDSRMLSVPKVRRQYGERAFAYIGPVLWNTLPYQIRHTDSTSGFKRQLKAHLFLQYLHSEN